MGNIRKLPSHVFNLTAGLVTNFQSESVTGTGFLQADNIDGFEIFRGTGKVPGSTRKSADHGSAVVSLHQFEYTDLAFARQRKQLTLAGGVLYDVNPGDLSLTSIKTGLVSEPLAGITMLNRIHLTSANQRDLPTGGIKHDGTNVRNWGVNSPGVDETPIQTLDDHTNWSDSTDATSSTNTAASQDQTASVQVDKDGTVTLSAYVERGGQSDDISSAGSDTLYVYFFLPAGGLQVLATSGAAVEIRFGNSGLSNSDAHQFSVGELVPGWNLLTMVLSAPDSTAGAGATLSSIDTWRLSFITKTTGTLLSGVLWDRLHIRSEGACTAVDADTTSGDALGTYTYRITFLTETGVESNAGAASVAATADGIRALCTLTQGGQPGNDQTVTIDTKTYNFETSLTNVDGNVFIGTDAATTIDNLIAAINLDAGAGSKYAADMTEHTTVSATNPSPTTALLTAKTPGTAANSFATTEDATNYSFTSETAFTGGAESNAIDLTAIPVSSDPQVIARRLYRDISSDNIWRFVTQIDDNVTTTYTDTIGDSSLGSTQPPLAGDAFIDNSPPGRMLTSVIHQNRIVGISADNRNTLVLSDINAPEQYRLIEQLTLEEELVALKKHAYGTLIYGTDKVFLMTGDGVRSAIRIEEISAELGANGFRSVTRFKGVNIAVRENQVFFVIQPTDPWYASGAIQDLLTDNVPAATLADAHLIHDRGRFRVVLFAKGSGGIYDQIFVWQYGITGASSISGDGPGVDPLDLRQGGWFKLVLPSAVQPGCSEIVETTLDQPELWVGSADGYVYHLQDTAATNYADNTTTAAIGAVFETTSVPLGSGPGGRGEPRFLKVNMKAPAQTTWTFLVTLLTDAGGKTIATKTFTHTFESGSTSAIFPVPKMGARGEWCKVKVSNAVASKMGVVKSLTLFYIPRGDLRGARSA